MNASINYTGSDIRSKRKNSTLIEDWHTIYFKIEAPAKISFVPTENINLAGIAFSTMGKQDFCSCIFHSDFLAEKGSKSFTSREI